MDNRIETEEEMRERIRKEIMDEMNADNTQYNGDKYRKEVLDELNSKGRTTMSDPNIESFGMKQKSKVSFNSDSNNNVNQIRDKNEDIKTTTDNKESSTAKPLIFACLLVCLIAVFFFPTIQKQITQHKNSKRKVQATIEPEKEKEYEKITLDSAVVKKLKYPVMHNDRTNKTTYYTNDKMTIQNFSNNDILYNTLLDIYEGNMGRYTGKYTSKYCGAANQKVAFEARYLDLRIDNLYTKKATYNLTSFVVPANNTKTSYVGVWKYEPSTKMFVYYGNCGKTPVSNIEYYDIKVPYEANASEKNIDIYVYNYMGFAVVNKTTKQYVIYKNANYTEQLTSGTLTTTSYETELTNILKTFVENNKTAKKYKYTFTIRDCAYQDYCYLSGEWVE